MKIVSLLLSCSLFCLCCLGLSSCKNKKNSDAQQDSIRHITQELPIQAHFSQLTILTDIDVEIREGDYRIVAMGDSAAISHLRYSIDTGGLVVSNPSSEFASITPYSKRNGLKLTVWCPKWTIVANYGRGHLTCEETIHADDLQLGCIRDGNLEMDSIVCTSFRYEGNNGGKCHIAYLTCQKTHLTLSGSSTFTAHVDVDTLTAGVNDESSATISGRADVVDTFGNIDLTGLQH